MSIVLQWVPSRSSGIRTYVGALSTAFYVGGILRPRHSTSLEGIPPGFSAIFAIKDDTSAEVGGGTIDGSIVSAGLTPGEAYTIEVTLTEVVSGITLECPAIFLDFVTPLCES